MKYYDGESLNKKEQKFFFDVTGGLTPDPEMEIPRRWCVIVGAGGGKSRFISRTSLYRGNVEFDPVKYPLQPGQKAENIIIAPSIGAGMINIEYIQSMLEESDEMYDDLVPYHPGQNPIVKNRQEARMQFKNRAEIKLSPVARISGRGRSIWTLVMEESAHFRVEGRFSDSEIYKSAAPRLGRFGMGSMCFLVTTPWDKSGLVWDVYKKYYGKQNDSWLVVKGTTKQFNPCGGMPSEAEFDRFLAKQEEEDPEAFRREFLAEFSETVYGAFSSESIESAIVTGRKENRYNPAFKYFGFIDSAGLSISQTAKFNDEFASGVAHVDGSKIVIDALRGWKAMTDGKRITPEDAAEKTMDLFEKFQVREVLCDQYGAGYNENRFSLKGYKFEKVKLNKSDLFLSAIPLLNDGDVELLDEEISVRQLKSLERKRGTTGRDQVLHPKDAHDDRANVIAGLIYMGRERMGVARASLSSMRLGTTSSGTTGARKEFEGVM